MNVARKPAAGNGRRVLHVMTADGGGAGRAARRLHEGLLGLGCDSEVAVGRRLGEVPEATALVDLAEPAMHPLLRAAERHAPKTQPYLGDVRLPLRSVKRFPDTGAFRSAEVINLHNLHGNYFDYRALPAWAARKPLTWTVHDMWPLTGHCAYSFDCDRWRTGCHDCPLYEPELRALDEMPQPPLDRTRPSWRAKRATYSATPLVAVAPSKWMHGLLEDSIVLAHPRSRAVHIPYGLDTEVYRPRGRERARDLLGIPSAERVLLFPGSTVAHPRKGFEDLEASLAKAGREVDDLCLLSYGGASSSDHDTPYVRRSVGACSDESLQSIVYSAADLVAVPSRGDNQPLVILEAMASGVPVVAYGVGGIPEQVQHLETGYCARPGDVDDLAAGVRTLLRDRELVHRLGEAARRRVEREHSLVEQARRYAQLYDAVVEAHASGGSLPVA